jgi:hypothetical protein
MNLPPPSGKVSRTRDRRKVAASFAAEKRFRALAIKKDAEDDRVTLVRRYPGQFLKKR